MDSFMVDLLTCKKIPKWLRYLLLAVLVGAVAYIGVMIALNSSMAAGRLFGAGLTLVILVLGWYAAVTVRKSE